MYTSDTTSNCSTALLRIPVRVPVRALLRIPLRSLLRSPLRSLSTPLRCAVSVAQSHHTTPPRSRCNCLTHCLPHPSTVHRPAGRGPAHSLRGQVASVWLTRKEPRAGPRIIRTEVPLVQPHTGSRAIGMEISNTDTPRSGGAGHTPHGMHTSLLNQLLNVAAAAPEAGLERPYQGYLTVGHPKSATVHLTQAKQVSPYMVAQCA